jgi:predicted nucleic acid-binding protein
VIVVLDIGGVEGLAPIDERRRARLRVLREQAADMVVPAAVLAEGVFSGHVRRDHHVRGLLKTVDVLDVDPDTCYAAGALRQEAIAGGVDPPPSGVEAIVAATADVRARADDVVIVTSDPDDLELLAAGADNPRRLTILRA